MAKEKSVYERLSRELDDVLKRKPSRTINRVADHILTAYKSNFDELNTAQRGIYQRLQKAEDLYGKKELNRKQFESILRRAVEGLRGLTRRHHEGLERILTSHLDKAAAVLFLFVSIFYLNKASITGYAVASSEGSAGYYSLFGLVFLTVAILVLVYERKK